MGIELRLQAIRDMDKERRVDLRGNWQLLAGGALAVAAMFVLTPGINEVTAALYTEQGGDLMLGLVLTCLGAALLLTGLAILIIGYFRRRSRRRQVRSYDDVGDDHTAQAERRFKDAYDRRRLHKR